MICKTCGNSFDPDPPRDDSRVRGPNAHVCADPEAYRRLQLEHRVRCGACARLATKREATPCTQ